MSMHVVTGVGPDGRSRVIAREEKVLGAAHAAGLKADDSSVREGEHSASLRIAKLCEIGPAPRIARPAKGVMLPVSIPPWGVAWFEMKFDGSTVQQLHRTDSIDFHYIVSGEVDLVLEAGDPAFGRRQRGDSRRRAWLAQRERLVVEPVRRRPRACLSPRAPLRVSTCHADFCVAGFQASKALVFCKELGFQGPKFTVQQLSAVTPRSFIRLRDTSVSNAAAGCAGARIIASTSGRCS